MLPEKVAQLPRCLERGDVAVDVQPVNTSVGHRNVISDNLGHIGRHGFLPSGMRGFSTMMIRWHDVGVYRLHFGTGPNFFLEENQEDAAI